MALKEDDLGVEGRLACLFERGVMVARQSRDFSDALNAFFQMRARYLQAVFDLNVAASTLARVTGASEM